MEFRDREFSIGAVRDFWEFSIGVGEFRVQKFTEGLGGQESVSLEFGFGLRVWFRGEIRKGEGLQDVICAGAGPAGGEALAGVKSSGAGAAVRCRARAAVVHAYEVAAGPV